MNMQANISDADAFIEFINLGIKRADSKDKIEKNNNYLYLFVKTSMRCMNKIDNSNNLGTIRDT